MPQSLPTPSASSWVSVPLHMYTRDPSEAPIGGAPVLIALHGYAMAAPGLLAVLSPVVPPEFLLISLQGPMSTLVPGVELEKNPGRGYHWGCSPRMEENRSIHRDAVEQAMAWARKNGGDGARVSLIGFSQPCSFNYRLAMNPPEGVPLRCLVALCGGIPGDWDGVGETTGASRHTHVLHVSTTSDPFYPAEKIAPYRERLVSRFASAAHSLHRGGHRLPSSCFGEIGSFLSRFG